MRHENKDLVLRPVHPGTDDGYADLFVQRHDVLFKVVEKISSIALVNLTGPASRKRYS